MSVALGDEMVLTAGPCSMTVNVVSTRPKAPVCALFAGTTPRVRLFAEQPKGDADTPPPSPPTSPEQGSRRRWG